MGWRSDGIPSFSGKQIMATLALLFVAFEMLLWSTDHGQL